MTDEKDVPVELGRLVLEGLEANSYEIVIAVSKMAREMNTKAQKYLGPENEVKPVNLAMGELKDSDVVFQYSGGNQTAAVNGSATDENESV